ncbi:uncharacterized protein LOC108090654 isoform X2 [Drosophila ficusphila]|uniref:uncharacterized protein LOC108090654 isoform X2 n=1 Tax=Drosophila ficusphila TaxID=30025 RepID=UPI0007E5D562|nr:uncharacterized protein LOC108090654 isoform X2 [Drosophila ficusphila]
MDILEVSDRYSHIGNSFGLVCRTIEKQCGVQRQGLVEKFEFEQLLKILNAKEKMLAAKFFCQLPTNVGSFRVLLQLQDLGYLTATEYILCKKDSDQLQVDMIIFLESEFKLLENIFTYAAYNVDSGLRLKEILTAALGNLYSGLLNNPKISNLGYVEPLRKALPDKAISLCIKMHLSTLLELHRAESITEAFANFSAWINEGVDELTFVKHLCEKLFLERHEEVLQYLFKQSKSENFKHWRFYLILVQSIAISENPETVLVFEK